MNPSPNPHRVILEALLQAQQDKWLDARENKTIRKLEAVMVSLFVYHDCFRTKSAIPIEHILNANDIRSCFKYRSTDNKSEFNKAKDLAVYHFTRGYSNSIDRYRLSKAEYQALLLARKNKE